MTTFYLDQEGGNDANDGTTFANRWKTFTLGATAARIAAGDTIRVMASPAPTSLGVTGVWTNGPLPATISITSSTNATPIVVTKVAHGLVNGDTIYITGHTTNTNANGTWEVANKTADTFELANSIGNGVGGASGTFRNINNSRITLASALTKNIASCGNRGSSVGIPTAWTASASVTCTVLTTDFKDGDRSDKIDIAAGFTTGLAAYWALGSAVDFSAYKQVSFWIKQTSGTIGAAGATQIKLCSDTAGVTAVDTIDIPVLGALNRWQQVTVNKAGALGASIQSVAFYVVTDNAAQIFQLSNIIACKDSTSADSLSLTSLIGKNTSLETWYGIQSINGTRVILDMETNTQPSSTVLRGYSGTTETITTYKRETIKTTVAPASTTSVSSVTDSGTLTSPIVFSGGWDRTDMTTQTGDTWFDGQNGYGYGLIGSAVSYFQIDKVCAVRYNYGYYGVNGGFRHNITNFHGNNNTTYGISVNVAHDYYELEILSANNNGSIGFFQQLGNNDKIISCIANNNGLLGIEWDTSNNSVVGTISASNNASGVNGQVLFQNNGGLIVDSLTSKDSTGYGICFRTVNAGILIRGGSSSNNSSGSIIADAQGTDIMFRNFTINESTEVAFNPIGQLSDAQIRLEKNDGTAFNDKIILDGATISKVTDQLHGSSNYSWKFQPTNGNRRSIYPVSLKFARVAVNSTGQVDFKVWVRVDDVNMFVKVLLRGGQIAGASADVSAVSTGASLNAWEQLTVSFTPTEKGVIEYVIQGYTDDGATTLNGWASDPSVTQV